MAAAIALRAAVHNLCSTPAKELPLTAEYIATTISECSVILSAPTNRSQPPGEPDRALLIQKLKARITSLLQDRTVEGRWTGVVLVKSMVESGKWEILRGCETWARSILAILGKPDPLSLKRLSILCLTRIFQLTHPYPTLTREITTPTLPQFITACLNIISTKVAADARRNLKYGNPLIDAVFCSLLTLLPNHPTIFRPFSAQIHSLVLPLIASSCSRNVVPESTGWAAQQLFISLHQCAPKNTANEEWIKAIRTTILATHRTADHLFRAIVEHWESVDSTLRQGTGHKPSDTLVGDDGPDPLGLPRWAGIQQGSGQLIGLLELLSSFLKSRSHATVSIPIGSILDLISRLASIIVPASTSGDDATSTNPEIGRDEKEALWSVIPSIHAATLDLQQTILELFGSESSAIARNCLEQTMWVFSSSSFNRSVRKAAYGCVSASLAILGPTLTKPGVSSLAPVISTSCNDLRPLKDSAVTEKIVSGGNGKSGAAVTSNADAFLESKSKTNPGAHANVEPDTLTKESTKLLLDVLTYIPTELIPLSLRAKIDRTSIVTANSDLMMASVLNPISSSESQRGHPSVLPFLARNQPSNSKIEGLLRPRMPVIITGAGRRGNLELEHDEMEDEAEAYNSEMKSMPKVDPRESLAEKLGARHASVPAETATPPKDMAIGNKRRHPEDIDNTLRITSSQPDKRPRVQDDLPIASDALPSQQAAEVDVPSRPLASLSDQDILKVNEFPEPETKHPIPNKISEPNLPPRAVQNHEETHMADTESDDEIPQLNIESDTDEDDE
ncbi:hypothetical protein McanCB56680_002149 [Microsporum canis]|uniref:Pre-rRNA-processing protein RIX1 n=1 Tax=Arthroderma otae (strain ATCC MYA-4605 / CBS 113480) TaxID=554155 RepID=C5FVY6_ARTOC|nr:conserved hypothetical protein [Microsporum canis CBS 113480]EEQ34070.1 conserved hypothetical protein [Microsporum canis CBS 113480]